MATGRRKVYDTARGGEVYRGCVGKRRYTSKRMASGVLRVMRAERSHTLVTLHPYRCKVCKGWHLGNTGRRRHEREEAARRGAEAKAAEDPDDGEA